ncbi:MAG: lipopolysaccharide assembly protein LapA domain-containing protein [Pseudomonadota bacterium]
MAFLKKWLVRLLILVVFIAALLAAADNSAEVPLTFLDWQTPAWPVSWWVLSAFLLGTLFGVLLNFAANTRLRLDARKAKKDVRKTVQELDRVRAETAPAATNGG